MVVFFRRILYKGSRPRPGLQFQALFCFPLLNFIFCRSPQMALSTDAIATLAIGFPSLLVQVFSIWFTLIMWLEPRKIRRNAQSAYSIGRRVDLTDADSPFLGINDEVNYHRGSSPVPATVQQVPSVPDPQMPARDESLRHEDVMGNCGGPRFFRRESPVATRPS